MGTYEDAIAFLPDCLARPLDRLSLADRKRVQEIRLRRNGFLTVSLPEGERVVDTAGFLSESSEALAVYCNAQDLEKSFLKLCDYSVHSHSDQLRAGYITAKGGMRVGISGTAVTENGKVTTVKDITSLCIRVGERHDGCAAALYPLFYERIPSLLIVGEPASGKTAILRDLARVLCNGTLGKRRRVAIVDEREEIAGIGGLENADVLRGIAKPVGVLQALRTLAPEVILLDELGTYEEVDAVMRNLHAGVPAIATAHCRNPAEAWHRPAVRMALQCGAFEKVVFLKGRASPGAVESIVEVDPDEMDRLSDAGVQWYLERHHDAT